LSETLETSRDWLSSRRLGFCALALFLLSVLILFALPTTAYGEPMDSPLFALGWFVISPASAAAALGAIPSIRSRVWLVALLTPVAYFAGFWLFIILAMNLGRAQS
jgi:hypothetical protein